jgi:hypothetical protein
MRPKAQVPSRARRVTTGAAWPHPARRPEKKRTAVRVNRRSWKTIEAALAGKSWKGQKKKSAVVVYKTTTHPYKFNAVGQLVVLQMAS